MDLAEQIEDLEKRIVKLNKERESIGKEQAVLEDRYDSALADLKSFGIDAEGIKKSELLALKEEKELELQKELDRVAAVVAKGEKVISDFKKAQG